jgi:hypothetical protein
MWQAFCQFRVHHQHNAFAKDAVCEKAINAGVILVHVPQD